MVRPPPREMSIGSSVKRRNDRVQLRGRIISGCAKTRLPGGMEANAGGCGGKVAPAGPTRRAIARRAHARLCLGTNRPSMASPRRGGALRLRPVLGRASPSAGRRCGAAGLDGAGSGDGRLGIRRDTRRPQQETRWGADVYQRWRDLDAELPESARRDGGGPSRARNNPPGYYLYEVPSYTLASHGDIFTRLYVARLWSTLLLLVTVSATWLLAGEVLGRDRLLQLSAAAVTGLQPMVSFISGSVDPDAMLVPAWAVTLWLGVRLLKHGFTLANAAALLLLQRWRPRSRRRATHCCPPSSSRLPSPCGGPGGGEGRSLQRVL